MTGLEMRPQALLVTTRRRSGGDIRYLWAIIQQDVPARSDAFLQPASPPDSWDTDFEKKVDALVRRILNMQLIVQPLIFYFRSALLHVCKTL